MRKRVFFVSDRTGITVEALGSSLISQFADIDFLRVTLPFIDSIPKAIQVVAQVNAAHQDSGERPLVFSSIVDDAVREEITKCSGLVLDVFERFIVPLEQELGRDLPLETALRIDQLVGARQARHIDPVAHVDDYLKSQKGGPKFDEKSGYKRPDVK